MLKNNSGFTLIELLVVIAIIGLLSSLTVFMVNSARDKSRDVRRYSDIDVIQTALDLYHDDHGQYPEENRLLGIDGFFEESSNHPDNFLEPLVSGGYLSEHVLDPVNDENHWYGYRRVTEDDHASMFGCLKEFYVLLVVDLITVSIPPSNPNNKSLDCGSIWDWFEGSCDYVVGKFEN